jgi:hypothetical protein
MLLLDWNKRKTNSNKREYGSLLKSLTKEKLIEMYLVQNKSLQDIANEYNCTRQMVKVLMDKYSLQRRSRSEARVLAIKYAKFKDFKYDPINEHFFKEWTPQMAWVLGLFLTDGCLYKSTSVNYAFSISVSDIELISKIKSCLNSEKKIIESNQSYDKTRLLYRFEIHRDNMLDDLINLGLTQRKSLNLKFPEVPEEYMRHFIRGCWDGDGSVFLSAGKLRASYVSGSKAFVQTLVEELYKAGIYRKILHTDAEPVQTLRALRAKYPTHQYPIKIHVESRSKSPSYSIKIDSRNNLMTIYNYFYDGVNESMYLGRKHDLFVHGLGLVKT